MEKVKKSREKVLSVMIVSASISLVLMGLACHRPPVSTKTATGSGDGKAASDRVAEAETLYQGREDINKARLAVASLRQALTADYGNYEASWKLSRAAFYVAEHTDNDTERDDMYREGIEAGKAAVSLQPDKPDGHFWLGANYGGSAAHSTLVNLSSFHDIQGEMEAVLKIDESYEGYSSYLGLGRLYLQAPRVLGGDSKKAIEYLEKGVKLSPNNTIIKADLAEAYINTGRTAEAKKLIDAIMAATPDPKYAPEHKDAVAKAQRLLQRIH